MFIYELNVCGFEPHCCHCSVVTYDGNLFPAHNYLSKFNNRNTRRRFEKSSKLTIKTPERRQWLGNQWLPFNIFMPSDIA